MKKDALIPAGSIPAAGSFEETLQAKAKKSLSKSEKEIVDALEYVAARALEKLNARERREWSEAFGDSVVAGDALLRNQDGQVDQVGEVDDMDEIFIDSIFSRGWD